MDKIIESILNMIDKKGAKYVLLFVIGCIIFVSPSFLLLFLYNNSIFKAVGTLECGFFIIALSCIVFLIIFIIASIKNVDLDNFDYKGTIENDLLKSLFFMFLLSVTLLIGYLISELIYSGINKSNRLVFIGIVIFTIYIMLIGFRYAKLWIRVLCRIKDIEKKNKKLRIKREELNKKLNDLKEIPEIEE